MAAFEEDGDIDDMNDESDAPSYNTSSRGRGGGRGRGGRGGGRGRGRGFQEQEEEDEVERDDDGFEERVLQVNLADTLG